MIAGEEKLCRYSALEMVDVIGDNRERFWGADFAVKKDRLVVVGGYAERTERQVNNFTYERRNTEGIEEKKYDSEQAVLDEMTKVFQAPFLMSKSTSSPSVAMLRTSFASKWTPISSSMS